MLFSGDIIIIDPCYAIRKDNDFADYQKSGYGENMKALGFSRMIHVYTFWQDCGKVKNTDSGEILGTISAESGALCVLYYDELMKYNPDYFTNIGDFETATIIRNFHGEITIDALYGRIQGKGNINLQTVLDVEEEKMSMLRISDLVNDSIVDGVGLRFTVFVQGCPHHCKGCHNPQTHDFNAGRLIAIDEIVEKIASNPLLDGVTFSGGEPFCQAMELYELGKKIREMNLNITTYTGYTFEYLYEHLHGGNGYDALLSVTDWLVDGRFIEEQRSLELKFRGSANQRIIWKRRTRHGRPLPP